MYLVHISDIHFGNKGAVFDATKLKDALCELIRSLDGGICLVVSGDVTFRGGGKGFSEAKVFFNDLVRDSKLDCHRILLCPGNHDLVNNSFAEFDEFVNSVRCDNAFRYSQKSFFEYVIDDVCFILANTSDHLEYQYGMVSTELIRYIEDNNDSFRRYRKRVLVLHHHFFNQDLNDDSTIKNAYPILVALDKTNFNLVLHGHRHSKQEVIFGRSQMIITSARSLNYSTLGVFNGLNVIDIDGMNEIQMRKYAINGDAGFDVLALEEVK